LVIFVHWGLFSVPGWAPTTGDLDKVVEQQGWSAWFAQNPYAEWYLNSLKFENSPSHQYHTQTYGANTSYDDFVPIFNEAIKNWQPDAWADLFQRAGARYAVLVTKHHDGFLLWPSAHGNPFKSGYQASRDIAGELTEAVRQRGLHMGLYYSCGLDWTFQPDLIHDFPSLFAAIPQDEAYVAYVDAHWRELVARYWPALMWNDIGYPANADLPQLFADYYNAVPDGVINDRFRQAPPGVPSGSSQAAPDPSAAPPARSSASGSKGWAHGLPSTVLRSLIPVHGTLPHLVHTTASTCATHRRPIRCTRRCLIHRAAIKWRSRACTPIHMVPSNYLDMISRWGGRRMVVT